MRGDKPARVVTDAGTTWLVLPDGQRVPLPAPGGGGISQDDADLRYVDVTGDSMSGNLAISRSGPTLNIDQTDAADGSLTFRQSGSARWQIAKSVTETGTGDVGGDLYVKSRHDDGTANKNALVINRATGLVTVVADPVAPLGVVTKQYSDATAWTALPMQGAWVGYGSSFEMPRYCRYGNGVVRLQGLVKGGTANPVALLPTGHRPTATLYFASVRDMNTFAMLSVKADGTVEMFPAPSAAVGWLSVNCQFQT